MYTISFKARASKESSANVTVMMNHDPWSNLGFYQNVKLNKIKKAEDEEFMLQTSENSKEAE